jgi:amidohydrolase
VKSPLPAVRKEVQLLRDRIVQTRRHFHQYPEVSWKEERTQATILERLTAIGLEDVRPVAKTGATAVLRGSGAGAGVLWRADIDALPIPEQSGLPFASRHDGVMHACGHDGHIAVALGIAEALVPRAPALGGSVRFLFQPAEEAAGGAPACIREGVLEDPRIDRVLGLHIAADVPLGAVNVAPGPFFAAPTAFRITITGRGGHAASPHQAIDSVVVAAHVVTALQTVVSRATAPADSAVLTVGKIQAGFRGNVIAESATMTGTIRSYTDPVRELMLSRAEEIVAGVCSAFGAGYRFDHNTSCPPVVNDPQVTDFVTEQARTFFGHDRIFGLPSMGADDMACYLRERPGCYFWLGGRNEAKGIAGRHHDPGFVFDEDVLTLGVEFGMRLIEGSLAGE